MIREEVYGNVRYLTMSKIVLFGGWKFPALLTLTAYTSNLLAQLSKAGAVFSYVPASYLQTCYETLLSLVSPDSPFCLSAGDCAAAGIPTPPEVGGQDRLAEAVRRVTAGTSRRTDRGAAGTGAGAALLPAATSGGAVQRIAEEVRRAISGSAALAAATAGQGSQAGHLAAEQPPAGPEEDQEASPRRVEAAEQPPAAPQQPAEVTATTAERPAQVPAATGQGAEQVTSAAAAAAAVPGPSSAAAGAVPKADQGLITAAGGFIVDSHVQPFIAFLAGNLCNARIANPDMREALIQCAMTLTEARRPWPLLERNPEARARLMPSLLACFQSRLWHPVGTILQRVVTGTSAPIYVMYPRILLE